MIDSKWETASREPKLASEKKWPHQIWSHEPRGKTDCSADTGAAAGNQNT